MNFRSDGGTMIAKLIAIALFFAAMWAAGRD